MKKRVLFFYPISFTLFFNIASADALAGGPTPPQNNNALFY